MGESLPGYPDVELTVLCFEITVNMSVENISDTAPGEFRIQPVVFSEAFNAVVAGPFSLRSRIIDRAVGKDYVVTNSGIALKGRQRPQ